MAWDEGLLWSVVFLRFLRRRTRFKCLPRSGKGTEGGGGNCGGALFGPHQHCPPDFGGVILRAFSQNNESFLSFDGFVPGFWEQSHPDRDLFKGIDPGTPFWLMFFSPVDRGKISVFSLNDVLDFLAGQATPGFPLRLQALFFLAGRLFSGLSDYPFPLQAPLPFALRFHNPLSWVLRNLLCPFRPPSYN